jgi:phosphoenolpyruvate carboxykinase (ATP)
MYHFVSGYTSKVAGTEAGITEPQSTFSACFGQAFLPLHPAKYAELLGAKLNADTAINVWLVNTGWSGGGYGVGSRMKLSYTRAMLTAALNGELDSIEFTKHPVFGVQMPNSCPNVPQEILHPRNTWADKAAYDQTANALADKFNENFKKFEDGSSEAIKNAAPKAVQAQ